MPVTITRPRASRIVSTAATKGAPSPSDMAAASAARPSDSVSSEGSAEAMEALIAGFGFPDALILARVPTRNSTGRNITEPLQRSLSLFPPGREGISKSAIAGRALFQRQDGAAAIGIDDWNVEPRPLLEKLDIALHVGIDRGKTDQEEAVRHLDRKPGEGCAARLLGLLHQYPGHVGDGAAGKVGRQIEHDFDGVACRQGLVGIAAQCPGYGHVLIGNFYVCPHFELGRESGARRNRVGAPDGGTDITLDLGIFR